MTIRTGRKAFCAVLLAGAVLASQCVAFAGTTGTRKYLVPGTNALLTYTYDTSDNTAAITDSENVTGDFVIPSMLDGTYTVTAIEDAFGGNNEITSVVIPNTVKSLEDTFELCQNLTSVTLPEGLNEIGVRCFKNTGITSITIPRSVTKIGGDAFYGCNGLTSVVIPGSVKNLGIWTFMYCKNLTSATIENGVTQIPDSTFNGCPKLTSVTIPESVTEIGYNAFEFCSSLDNVTLPSGLKSLHGDAFCGCTSLKEIKIPASVTVTDTEIFKDCTALQSVTIPKEWTVVNYSMFDGCTALKDVYYTGSEAQSKTMTIRSGNDPLYYANWHYLNQVSFSDVPSGAYFYTPVYWAVKQSITAGTSAAAFSPDAACTRAQAVTFLWRGKNQPEATGSLPFTDVDAGGYYAPAVRWAVQNNVTAGTSGSTFSPNGTCTRAQIVTFLWRANGQPASGTSLSFRDVDAGSYYADAVRWAVEKGITSGTDATHFAPNATCTRAQIVTFLWRLAGSPAV